MKILALQMALIFLPCSNSGSTLKNKLVDQISRMSFINYILILFIFFAVTRAVQAQAIDQSEPDIERLLIQRENALMQAVMDRDSTVMNEIMGDDFLLTSSESSGYLMPKQQYVRGSMMPKILQVDSFRFHDFKIRVFAGKKTAIVHCRIDWKSTYRGKAWNSDFLMTDVWMNRDGAWKLISRHSSYPRKQITLSASAAATLIGSALTDGVELVYESGGQALSPWIYESVRVVAREGFDRCVVVARQSQAVRESCVRGDTLFERSNDAYRAVRPIGPNMELEVRAASGNVLHYTTAGMANRTIAGREFSFVTTTILTRDTAGTVIRRLREHFAPSLLTALWGVFEEPAASGGWVGVQEFSLSDYRRQASR